MLNFRPIELEDKALVESYYGKENHFLCDYCFTDLFIWGKHYNTQICEYNGFLYTKMNEDNVDYFFAPEGDGDIKSFSSYTHSGISRNEGKAGKSLSWKVCI